METSNALRPREADVEVETYSAWLELEIGLDSQAIALSHAERTKLFQGRIEQGLIAIEHASPGLRAKLEAFIGRPFAFTASLTTEEIKAIWHLPELRFLSDRDANKMEVPVPDELGRLPFIVTVQMHIQAEGSAIVSIDETEVLVRASDKEEAKTIAVDQCSDLPQHFMDCDFRIHRRWWTAESADLNIFYNEERLRNGAAIVVDQRRTRKLKDQPQWRPNACVERVGYGSPKQRPRTWEWMIA